MNFKVVERRKLRAFQGALIISCSIGSINESLAQLEEVIVTAERRESNIQDTPISIAAFSAVDIEKLHIEQVVDISDVTPNLNIVPGKTGGATTLDFNIRGVGGGGVALYIDDIYYPEIERSLISTFDIQSIEVLRGPQGTLFGRNATGGAIRITTRKPHDQFEAQVKTTVGERNKLELNGLVNIPVSDELFVKASLTYSEEDGYIDTIASQSGDKKGGAHEGQSGLIALRWLAYDDVTLDVSGAYIKADGNPVARINTYADFSTEGSNLNRTVPGVYETIFVNSGGEPLNGTVNDPRLVSKSDFMAPGTCILDDTDPMTNDADVCRSKLDVENIQLAAKLNWDISDSHNVKISAGYHDISSFINQIPLSLGGLSRSRDLSSEAYMLESVFDSNLLDGKLNLTYGVNYYSADRNQVTGGYSNDRTDDLSLMVAASSLTDNTGETDALGVFVQGDYELTSRSTLTLGVRYTDESQAAFLRTFESDNFNINIAEDAGRGIPAFSCDTASSFRAPPDPITGVYTLPAQVYDTSCSLYDTVESDWQEIDWKTSIRHAFKDDLMAYFTIAKAYKSGAAPAGRNAIVANQAPELVDLKFTNPEEVLSYEAGIRSDLFDYRFRLNASVFYMDFSNRQQLLRKADGNGDITLTATNVGDVTTQGFELDMTLAASEAVTLGLSYGYNHTELEERDSPTVVHIVNVPESSLNFRTDYVLSLDTGVLTLGMNYTWQDSFYENPSEGTAEDSTTDSYGSLNGRINYQRDDWSITLGATNILDDQNTRRKVTFGGVFAGSAVPGPPSPAYTSSQVNQFTVEDIAPPRTVYLTLEKRFGSY